MYRTVTSLLISLVLIMMVFGVVMLYSTSYDVFGESKVIRQLFWILAGIITALILSRLDYHLLTRYSLIILMAVALPLLYLAGVHVLSKISFIPRELINAFPFTDGIKGSYRWLKFGPIRLQPSEFAKVAIILFLAHYYSKNSRYIGEFKRGFLMPMIIVGGVMVLVLLGGSLSVTAITGGVVLTMIFIAGIRLRYLFPIFIGGFLLVAAVAITSPERLSRLTSFRNPELVQKGDGYQLWNSFLALGSGGWNGLGFTESRMKRHYLPEAHTDFIISIVGEELGYLTVVMIILGYCLLTTLTFWLGAMAADKEGSLVCAGAGISFGLHAFVNVGVVSGFLPTTGVTAPFISYGGSNILASMLGVGLFLSVARISEQMMQERDLAREGAEKPPPLIRDLFS